MAPLLTTEVHEYFSNRMSHSKVSPLLDLIAEQLDVRASKRGNLKDNWQSAGDYECDMDFYTGSGTQVAEEIMDKVKAGEQGTIAAYTWDSTEYITLANRATGWSEKLGEGEGKIPIEVQVAIRGTRTGQHRIANAKLYLLRCQAVFQQQNQLVAHLREFHGAGPEIRAKGQENTQVAGGGNNGRQIDQMMNRSTGLQRELDPLPTAPTKHQVRQAMADFKSYLEQTGHMKSNGSIPDCSHGEVNKKFRRMVGEKHYRLAGAVGENLLEWQQASTWTQWANLFTTVSTPKQYSSNIGKIPKGNFSENVTCSDIVLEVREILKLCIPLDQLVTVNGTECTMINLLAPHMAMAQLYAHRPNDQALKKVTEKFEDLIEKHQPEKALAGNLATWLKLEEIPLVKKAKRPEQPEVAVTGPPPKKRSTCRNCNGKECYIKYTKYRKNPVNKGKYYACVKCECKVKHYGQICS